MMGIMCFIKLHLVSIIGGTASTSHFSPMILPRKTAERPVWFRWQNTDHQNEIRLLHDPRLSRSQWQESFEQRGTCYILPPSLQQDRSRARKIFFGWERNINPWILDGIELLSAYPFTGKFVFALVCRQACTDLWSMWHVSWFRTDPSMPSVSNKSNKTKGNKISQNLRISPNTPCCCASTLNGSAETSFR